MSVGGINLGEMFKNVSTGLDSDSSKIQTKIEDLQKKESVNPADLMKLNFEVGQYNAKLEATSSLMKSMQDMLKSLAQRTG